MKKRFLFILFVTVVLFIGCSSTEVEDTETYEFLVANIDNVSEIQAYLEKEISHGMDIDREIMNSDTVLMIAARYTTNIKVLETIVSYFPSINKMNYETDMTALDYLSRREGAEEMHKYLMEAALKAEMNKKVDEVKHNVVKNILNKF